MAATSSLYAGGGIKSIQRGYTTTTNNSNSDVTITAVVLAKSFISASCKSGHSWGRATNNSDDGHIGNGTASGARLSSTTNVRIEAGSVTSASYGTATGPTLYWEVVEYE